MRMMTKQSLHPAEQYIEGVLDASIVVSKLVREAIERHERDLDFGHLRGLRFDRRKAQRVIDFFGFLRHSKGEWAGSKFVLEPWQQAFLWILFGWVHADNVASFTAIATTAVTTASPTAIAFAELASGLYGALDPAYVENSSFYMTSSTRAYLMSLTSTTGQPIIGNGPDGAPFSSLFGRPIVISQFTDQIAATHSPILFGSGVDSYTVREATGGLSVSVLRERFLDTAEIGVVGFGLVGGFSKAVSGSAPLVKLVMHA
jgi:hypothetical protein